MNFYRVGKVIGLTAGQVFNIDSSAYKHKAVFFPNHSSALNGITLTFNDAAGITTSVSIAIPANSTGCQTPYIFPGVVSSLYSNNATRVVLLG